MFPPEIPGVHTCHCIKKKSNNGLLFSIEVEDKKGASQKSESEKNY